MTQSQAYLSFKERTQEIFNFAVLVTTSVPVLKQSLNLFKKGTISRIPEPDFFEPSVIYEITADTIASLSEEQLPVDKIEELKKIVDTPISHSQFKKTVVDVIGEEHYKKHRNTIRRQSLNYINNISDCTTDYQSKLSSYLYFSLFSYFEAFISDLVMEIIDAIERLNTEQYFDNLKVNSDLKKNIKTLNKDFDPRKIDRYKKFSTQLNSRGYKPPEDLLLSTMLTLLKNKNGDLKANEIPDFLKKTFHFELSEDDNQTFHNLRANRNSIGHGDRNFNPSLKSVIDTNKFLKGLSAKIDEHISLHFKAIKNYQR
ncbi:hypothetical protein SAMN04488028_102366 [Reichenbachiella agariperforans]|uniref:RiboL-PSP-HEPN domain-containing protein n=1 Tax=Reichenbachiella agariperforans TaxID=156994 RepID=A0A1M6NR82_REIAG|nr:HEPN domain-containing protein [Reichenbachiella agariperforans]SHJ98136.1 hypothetical protein SAMN04488028_102366 [Reichenbachiella agariperforans]